MGPQDVALTLAEDKMAVTFDPSSGKSDTVHGAEREGNAYGDGEAEDGDHS